MRETVPSQYCFGITKIPSEEGTAAQFHLEDEPIKLTPTTLVAFHEHLVSMFDSEVQTIITGTKETPEVFLSIKNSGATRKIAVAPVTESGYLSDSIAIFEDEIDKEDSLCVTQVSPRSAVTNPIIKGTGFNPRNKVVDNVSRKPGEAKECQRTVAVLLETIIAELPANSDLQTALRYKNKPLTQSLKFIKRRSVKRILQVQVQEAPY